MQNLFPTIQNQDIYQIHQQENQEKLIPKQASSQGLMEDQANSREDNQQYEIENQIQELNNNNQYNNEDATNKGVVYMSRIPPFMTPNEIRKLLSSYNVQRIYLLPETQWVRNNRIKRGGSKRICFREGWIEFTDKRIARMVAMSFNGQKMSGKKGNFYAEDVWNLKYLSKFKWHNLTERLAHQERLKKERLRLELDQERKIEQFYYGKVEKSKMVKGIVKRKEKKGKELKMKVIRKAKQYTLLRQQQEQDQ